MRKIIFTLAAVIALASGCSQRQSHLEALDLLDKTIAESPEIFAQKEARIAALRSKLPAATAEERYFTQKDLYQEYKDFDGDSATLYAGRELSLAISLGKTEEATLWRIRKAAALIQTGNMSEADSLMARLDEHTLSKLARQEYYAGMLSLFQALTYYTEVRGTKWEDRSQYFALTLQYRDTLLKYADPSLPEYLNMRGWQEIDHPHLPAVRQALKRRIDASPLNTVADGVGAFVMAGICRREAKKDKMLHYLALSAVAYIRAGCRNNASESLQDLAVELMWHGDISHAFTYINFCSQNISTFRNRAQIVRTKKAQDEIEAAYLEYERGQIRLVTRLALGLSLLAVTLLAGFMFIWRQKRLLAEGHAALHVATERLRQTVAEKEELLGKVSRRNQRLAELNQALAEVGAVKDRCLGYAFSLSTMFIDKIDDVRRGVSRRLKVGRQGEAIRYLDSPEIVEAEIKAFHQGFDKTFLALYPDFVERLNELMLPGQEMRQRAADTLTTDLRILALMRLGITDGTTIADFLHCSLQSVYNSRRATYARANVPAKEFKERIAHLGRVNGEEITVSEC